jgi:transposase
MPDRAALTGILFVLRTGLPWEYPPAEMGCGSGISCWRRLHDWQQAGVWAALHRALLEHMEQAGQLDWSRTSLDSTSLVAKEGGLKRGRALRTGAGRARSATSSWTHTVPRSASP